MKLHLNKTSKLPSFKDDILPRINSNRKLQVKYAEKVYEVIGYYPDKLFLRDPLLPDCDLIVKMNEVKLLLRPMDSMTSQEFGYYQSCLKAVANNKPEASWQLVEWLNHEMFDYKDLIGRGLAEEK